ncbi:MAG: hypothetical protein R2838_09030 [Caldilineaceae bacterium]
MTSMEPTESPNHAALIDAMRANYAAYFRQFLSLPAWSCRTTRH